MMEQENKRTIVNAMDDFIKSVNNQVFLNEIFVPAGMVVILVTVFWIIWVER